MAFEIANGVFVACNKRKRINTAEIDEYLELLASMPIRIARGDWFTNIALESSARKYDLAAYDVAYVDVARREKLPLATSDEGMKKAALAEGVILI